MTVTARNYNDTSPAQQLQSSLAASSGATSVPVASVAGFPTPPFLLAIDRGTASQEVTLCTAIVTGGSPSFTVQRAYDGSPLNSHNIGAAVEHTSAAIDFNQANSFIVACGTITPTALTVGGSGVNGASGSPADANHVHALPGWGTAGVISTSNPSDAANAGVQNLFARADHVHARETRAGQIGIWGGPSTTIPSGAFLCDGGASISGGPSILTATYPLLFAAIGYSWGGSGGSFYVPDFRGYTLAMVAGALGLGFSNKTGAVNVGVPLLQHNHTVGGVGISTVSTQHSHSFANNVAIQAGSSLALNPTVAGGASGVWQSSLTTDGGNGATYGGSYPTHNHSATGTVDVAGTSGATMSVVQPTVGLNFIIWWK